MTRSPQIQIEFAMPGKLVVDNFAGGGGASTGIEAAIGRPCDIAINHDEAAIEMHKANHPGTRHLRNDILSIDPRAVCGSKPVGLAWFSPDCTNFSRAKGGKPRDQKIRDLMWVVTRWAASVRPEIIAVENVEEIQKWGPLDTDNLPIPERTGETFREWCAQLRSLGYTLEIRVLTAADYGAPTTRKRLFMLARRDGHPLVWPAPTHGSSTNRPWRTSSEIIDWSLPTPSIFSRSKPLAEKTMARIAEGMRRYVFTTDNPFICSIGEQQAIPTLIQTGYGERPGQTPRVPGLQKPLGTVVAGGSKHALVAAFIAKHYGGVVGHEVRRPLGTVTAKDHHSLVAAFLTKYYSAGGQHQPLSSPLHTVTTKARFGLVTIKGAQYAVHDIGMRMLKPHELYAAQGFPSNYIIDRDLYGNRFTQTEQIRLCGNSVSPMQAAALVGAAIGRHAPNLDIIPANKVQGELFE